MSIKDLGSIREEINEIDQQLSALFDRRMQITKDVALYKIANNMQVFDREREQQVIEKVVTCAIGYKFTVEALDYSPITGPEGNIEYLIHLRNGNEGYVFDNFY